MLTHGMADIPIIAIGSSSITSSSMNWLRDVLLLRPSTEGIGCHTLSQGSIPLHRIVTLAYYGATTAD